MNANPAKATVAPVVERPAAWVMGGLAVVFFIAAIVSMWWSYNERARWQVTDARLTANQVVNYQRWYGSYYRIQVEYSFLAHRDRFYVPYSQPAVYSDLKEAEAERRRMDGQRLHRIYYHPEDPNEIELDLGAARFFLFPLLLALASAGLALWILIDYLRHSARFCGVCGEGAHEMHRFCSRCGIPMPARKGRLRSEWGPAMWWEQFITPKPHPNPGRYWGRKVACGLAGLAMVFFSMAAWEMVARLWVMQSWNAATADVLASRVVSSHDGAARQVFQVETVFRHGSPAGTTARSDFSSRSYASVKRLAADYPKGANKKIWVNPSNPEQVRFGAGWLALKSDGMIPELFQSGTGSLAAAALCFLVWKERQYCRACKFRIHRHHAFCPYCGKSKDA